MTAYVRSALQAFGLTGDDQRAAETVLGRGHRLTRAVAHQHVLARQTIGALAALVVCAAAVVLHLELAPVIVAAAVVVALLFILGWLVAHHVARERARDLLATGGNVLAVSVVARESRRLASRRERESLARSIEALYRDAVRWYQILPRYRPPNGVQQLRNLSAEVKSIAKALRGDRVGVQGVALTVRLLTDGCQSPLYANELGPLREELNRIRYLLETADGRDTERSRAA